MRIRDGDLQGLLVALKHNRTWPTLFTANRIHAREDHGMSPEGCNLLVVEVPEIRRRLGGRCDRGCRTSK